MLKVLQALKSNIKEKLDFCSRKLTERNGLLQKKMLKFRISLDKKEINSLLLKIEN